MNNPKISVVIPLYNKEKSIARTIQSILKQTLQDFELVIVDDGSTDNSVDIVLGFKDDRIVLVQQKNTGPGAARNTGVRNATADWIVFLDADDFLVDDALAHFSRLTIEHPDAEIIDCAKYNRSNGKDVYCEHSKDGYVNNPMRECFLYKLLPGCGSTCFDRNFILAHPYNENIRRFEDAELIIRLFEDANKVYSSTKATLIHDCETAEASIPRKDVKEDYFYYLNFSGKGFWRLMCVYRTFLEERILYPETGRQRYSFMYYRYDLLLIFKMLNSMKKFL